MASDIDNQVQDNNPPPLRTITLLWCYIPSKWMRKSKNFVEVTLLINPRRLNFYRERQQLNDWIYDYILI